MAAQFADTFRFLNQLGTPAQKGVQVVMHNTLDASDYGLLSEGSFDPRPDYWAALLWKRLMGTVVLHPDTVSEPNLRIYAQCLNGVPGGVAVLAINIDEARSHELQIYAAARRYALTAEALTSVRVSLNGNELQAGADGSLPDIAGMRIESGSIRLAPESLTFLTFASAKNKYCR